MITKSEEWRSMAMKTRLVERYPKRQKSGADELLPADVSATAKWGETVYENGTITRRTR
jgi:hypothetical protein